MNILLMLYWEFFKTGLFSIGGGMATIPFLKRMGESTGWFTNADLMNMLAVSESTPGPIGINMATYVGFTVKGIPGVLAATIGEVTPSVIIILLIAAALSKFRNNRYVNNALYGIRPASTGLIGAAGLSIIVTILFMADGSFKVNCQGLILAVVIFIFSNYVKKTKKLHPIIFIAFSAVIGIIFRWQ
ncbi:MAG: chromate transporter [Lachnospiraceae bacterium]|nr:chromate transporter [Lachnospiraceae bacterium]